LKNLLLVIFGIDESFTIFKPKMTANIYVCQNHRRMSYLKVLVSTSPNKAIEMCNLHNEISRPFRVLAKLKTPGSLEAENVLLRLQSYLKPRHRFVSDYIYFIKLRQLADILFLISGQRLSRYKAVSVTCTKVVGSNQGLIDLTNEEEKVVDNKDDNKDEDEDKDENKDEDDEDDEDKDENKDDEDDGIVCHNGTNRKSKRKASREAQKRIKDMNLYKDFDFNFDTRNDALLVSYDEHDTCLRDHVTSTGRRGRHIGAGTRAMYDRAFDN
jgi:hypothetical protein